jgi:hypothetical protein
MCDTAECKRGVEETIEKLGGIDVVIANAVCLSTDRGFVEEVLMHDRAGRDSLILVIWMPWRSLSGIRYAIPFTISTQSRCASAGLSVLSSSIHHLCKRQ